MADRLLLLLLAGVVSSATASFFEVRYPSVAVTAETGGNVSVVAGPKGGDIYMNPGQKGTVFIGHTDMLKLFELVNSLPPIWGQKAPYGSLGTFLGGDNISVILTAQDPEGTKLRYEKVSGALPPNVKIDRLTGHVTGTAPDVDATYEFGVRVTDEHGKYADQTFSIDTRERDQCKSNPCHNGGTCTDDIGTFNCTCVSGYGGKTCTTSCASHAVGVSNSSKRIPDAQMSAHYSYSSSDHHAYEGRLGSSSGWIGESTSSWLQVDLGVASEVYAVATQGFASSSYTLSTYQLTYSLDGNSFSSARSSNSSTATFQGSGSSYTRITKQTLPDPVTARYIRFLPRTWTSTRPGMRVEVYACAL